MKLVGLRVIIATDDSVELKHVKPLIAELISSGGTRTVEGGGRIHWGTVEVLQGPESTRARGGRKRNQGQGELAT